MKILIAGNSQVACLKAAHRQLPPAGNVEFFFYSVPGGPGPTFTIENDRIKIPSHAVNPDHPPFVDSPETLERPIGSYDAILISALGGIGGGLASSAGLMSHGILHAYHPRANAKNRALLSKSCYREMINTWLRKQPGFQFLDALKAAYAGKIFVQPFPRVTSEAPQRNDWILNQLYTDAIGACRFFSESRDAFLRATCGRLAVNLLPYPEATVMEDPFTPSEFIQHQDGLHPNMNYGRLVLDQLLERATN
jgi:hypothetical protein